MANAKTNNEEKAVKYSNLYHELIARDDKKVKADALVHIVKRADVQIQSDILGAEEAIAKADSDLSKAYGQSPFSSIACIEANRDLKEAKENLSDLKALRKELFS